MCKAPAVDHQKLKKFDIAACQTLMQEPFVSTVNEALGTGDNNPKSRLCFPQPHAQHPIELPLHWLHNATAAGRLQKGRGFVRCSVGDAGRRSVSRFTFRSEHWKIPNAAFRVEGMCLFERWTGRLRASSGGLHQKHSERAAGARFDTDPARTLGSIRKPQEALMR
jgi:hypothetical protein